MNRVYNRLATLLFLLVGACNLGGDLQNPNEISMTGADVNLIMNAIQLDFADWYYTASTAVDPLVRMNAMTGGYRYVTANQPQRNDLLWQQSYQNVLVNAELMIPLAQSKGLTTHVAVGKALEAYVYMSLVDVFGDVPQSEALQGVLGNFNPKQDAGVDVYNKALALLIEARTELAKTGVDAGGPLVRDIFYGGNRNNWTALVNTLELKLQMNLAQLPAQAAAANARIAVLLNGSASSNIIDTEAENFIYKYGIATVPNSRHPMYNAHYSATKGAAVGYIANYYMHEAFGIWDLLSPNDFMKVKQDPRWRYYFYRQVGSIAQLFAVDPKALGCAPAAPPSHYVVKGAVFCIFDPGFYGRDHGDASGIPPSGPVQTCYGIYPAGGKIDDNPISTTTFFSSTVRGDGANGAGISPIWMSFYTDFFRAEYLARTGDGSGARIAMQAGISNSITQVKNFATAKGFTLSASNGPSTTNYKAAVDALYAAAARPLDVIGKEFYKAAWANGLELYNLYRRTSAPRDLQPMLQIGPGPWLRCQVYPSVYVNLNRYSYQPNRVFWDNNPDVLN